jgi:hypothetical protein
MDKTVDSGSTDMGSIPIRDAKTLKDTVDWVLYQSAVSFEQHIKRFYQG